MGAKVVQISIMAAVLLAVAAVAVGAQSATAPSSPGALGSSSTTSKQCYSDPCHGSSARETIYERIGNRKSDTIYGNGNNDRLHANTYTRDTDQVYARGGGTNYLYVNDGDTNDGAIGGRGYDICYVDAAIEAANTCDRVRYTN